MQTGWRLERTYLAGAGFPESRLEGLDINWADPLEPTGHAALWADNGAGKTTITALRFALYLPHSRDFIRGNSDRSLAKLVYSGNVCHVVEQATRVVEGEMQRIVVGMVADWSDGGTQDLDNPRSWAGSSMAGLPIRSDRPSMICRFAPASDGGRRAPSSLTRCARCCPTGEHYHRTRRQIIKDTGGDG
jgi:hypothetical protein